MWQLFKKELLHILRDRGLVLFILYAFTLDVYMAAKGFNLIPEMISISVLDEDNSTRSREFIWKIQPPAFQEPAIVFDRKEIDRIMNESKTVLSLIVPAGFERDILKGGATVQVLVDGTQSTAAYLSSAYMGSVVGEFSLGILKERQSEINIKDMPSADLRSRVYFNPDVRDDLFEGINEFFMVITLIGMILPAAILIREKEYGTIEQVLISPLDVRKLLLMKILASSLFLLTMISISFELVLKLWLGFPLKGGIQGFIFISLLYGVATSGLSFIIASVARRFSQIGMLTIAIFAPMLLLSGGWVPPEALPEWLRRLTIFSPLKHYMELGIGLLIRGADLGLLITPMIKLIILGTILMGTGYLMYRKRILSGE